MTSIFDQQEQALQSSQKVKIPVEPMTSSGYINLQLDDNSPMFSKQKMNFNPSDRITHVAIANDYLVLAMANGKLFRLDLKNPDHQEEIQFTKAVQPSSKLTGIFLDPLGFHLLLAFSPKTKEGYPELIYLHKKSTKLKVISKSRSHEVTEVGWNYDNKLESSSGPILLGTSQGHILEMELEAESDKMFSSQQTWRQVFDIGKGTDTPITGIKFHRVDSSNKYFVFVTTPNRLYQFIGQATSNDDKPSLQSIFHPYLTIPETGFQEIPSSLKYSKLQFCYDKNSVPSTFAWLTEPGLFYGQLDPKSLQNANSLFTQGKLISYPDNKDSSKLNKTPLNFVLSDFHALLMYGDRVKAVSLLNQELVFEDTFSETHGKLKSIIKDPTKRTIWAVTDKAIFRYKVIREDRNVWRIYSEKGEFDLAKKHCNNNPAFIDIINVKQAEILFAKEEYEKSAEFFAETQSSFETICLKFLELEQVDALKVYLLKRLDALAEDDKTLISMIVIWMTELFLSQLSLLRRTEKEDSQRYHELQSDFEVFLLQPKVAKSMQYVKSAIYDLMSSHGDKQNLTKLTFLNEDYESVIAENIYNKNYIEAIETLENLKKPDLFYEFTPELLQAMPKVMVNALISQGPTLKPAQLLPAFLSCESDMMHVSEILRYLEYVMENFNIQDRAVHNYLVTLYAEHHPELLMRYLARQGQDVNRVCYDVHYALRVCREKNIVKACVKLSALLGLWESAVAQALEVDDLALAKTLATMPDDEDLQKKLWLKIAEHVIGQKQDVSAAMSFLEECPLLKIEDVLPFFSEVVTMDHFREPICQSLQEYNNQIEDLKAEMEEATKAAEFVRSEIQSFRNCSVIVTGSEVCSLCDISLLLRPFYLFPCTHNFHEDCLLSALQPALSSEQRTKLAGLQRQLNNLSNPEILSLSPEGLQETLRNDIDDIIASECAYCGEHMIESIDKPFIEDDVWDAVAREWE